MSKYMPSLLMCGCLFTSTSRFQCQIGRCLCIRDEIVNMLLLLDYISKYWKTLEIRMNFILFKLTIFICLRIQFYSSTVTSLFLFRCICCLFSFSSISKSEREFLSLGICYTVFTSVPEEDVSSMFPSRILRYLVSNNPLET